MQDSKTTALVLKSLKDLGVHLALDDFGTGYSSLSYMRRFPIDTLKIDRSFVKYIVTDAADASVVSAVINMGKSMNTLVVAEGVETREQLSFLEAQHCNEAQGYLVQSSGIGENVCAHGPGRPYVRIVFTGNGRLPSRSPRKGLATR